MKFKLTVYCWLRKSPTVYEKTIPLMETYFDSYENLLNWLGAHSKLNFAHRDYLIKIESEEI